MSNESRGVRVWLVVQIVFLILKLFNVITWSWGVVLIPFWLHIGVWILIFLLAGICEVLD